MMPRSLLLAGVPLMVYALLGELLSCLGELLTEPLVALQLCIENRCSQPTGIHVALPVVSGNHATLTILIAASQQLVGDKSCRFKLWWGWKEVFMFEVFVLTLM